RRAEATSPASPPSPSRSPASNTCSTIRRGCDSEFRWFVQVARPPTVDHCSSLPSRSLGRMAFRLDNVGIVVEDLDAAVDFFTELGLELEGRGMVEREWAGRVTGLGNQRVEIAMMRTPDGHGR